MAEPISTLRPPLLSERRPFGWCTLHRASMVEGCPLHRRRRRGPAAVRRELAEFDAKHCPAQRRRFDLDRTAVQLNGLPNNGEAQPNPSRRAVAFTERTK